MKQLLGPKKHKKCEEIADKKYLVCYANGSRPHYLAECWYTNYDADYVNYKTRQVFATVRNGERLVRLHPL